MLPLLGSPYNIGQGFTVNADGSVLLTKQIPPTANHGLLSIGPGPWDGASAGKFVGMGGGQAIAINVPNGFTGALIYAQTNGIDQFRVDSGGAIGAYSLSRAGYTHSYIDLNTTSVIAIARTPGDIPFISRGAPGTTNDIFQAQNSLLATLMGVRNDGLSYATVGGLATKEKAGAPVDADWTVAPPDGTIVLDSTNNKIWARVGGVWKGVAVA